jgi:autotransporter translocation and assembly factor TamB
MPVAKITGQGLNAIAFSVALLWSCLIGERIMVQRAVAERVRVRQEMLQLQRQRGPIPVITPMPARLRRFLVTVG